MLQFFIVQLPTYRTINNFKDYIQSKIRIPKSLMNLVHNGNIIDDSSENLTFQEFFSTKSTPTH